MRFNQVRLLTAFSLFLICLSCNARDVKPVKPRLGRAFQVLFDEFSKPYNYGYFQQQGKGYFYGLEYSTSKKIRYFDSTGRIVKSIDLSALQSKIDVYDGVNVVDFNSAFSYCSNANGVYVFDSNFNVSSFTHVNYASGNIAYRAYSTVVSPSPDPDDILLHVEPVTTQFNEGASMNWKAYWSAGKSGPIALTLNSARSNPTLRPVQAGLWHRWAGASEFYVGSIGNFCRSNTYVYYVNPFCDSIFQIESQSGKLSSVKQIKSDFSRIGIPLPKNSREIARTLTYDFRKSGIISRMIFDPYSKLICIALYHESEVSDNDIKSMNETRPWSILLYDETLNKVAELKLPGGTYQPQTIFSSPEGIWVVDITKQPMQTFQLIKIR